MLVGRTLLIIVVGAFGASGAGAAPVDLGNPEARWVWVRFEDSPADQPGQLDTMYAMPLPAWLEPAGDGSSVRVAIRGAVVEQRLLARERPKPGSFSDFVWIFDVDSGHVHSATLSGTLLRKLGWGPFATEVETDLLFEMTTYRRSGFSPPRRLLGEQFFDFCTASDGASCHLVPPVPFDAHSGYVNAIGRLTVQAGAIRSHAFSPLGEAVFSEIDDAEAPAKQLSDVALGAPGSEGDSHLLAVGGMQ